ncbi:MAG: hypothetical protein V1918_04135 [Planctomycetota bacterium]
MIRRLGMYLTIPIFPFIVTPLVVAGLGILYLWQKVNKPAPVKYGKDSPWPIP